MPSKKTTKKVKKKKADYIFSTGKRKRAVARAKIGPGRGRVLINSRPMKLWGTEMLRLWLKEPLSIGESVAKSVDISINVKGGGVSAQAEASRLAIARGLVKFSKDKKLKKKFLDFDRNLLVYDPRRTEPHKPSRSRKGARRHKQRSKR
jgi:small subunit ribosomal protein S9